MLSFVLYCECKDLHTRMYVLINYHFEIIVSHQPTPSDLFLFKTCTKPLCTCVQYILAYVHILSYLYSIPTANILYVICMYVHTCIYVHSCIIHTYIHTYISTYVYTVRICIRMYVCTDILLTEVWIHYFTVHMYCKVVFSFPRTYSMFI